MGLFDPSTLDIGAEVEHDGVRKEVTRMATKKKAAKKAKKTTKKKAAKK